jgi:hypothetical protein
MACVYYIGGNSRGDSLRFRVARLHGSRGAPSICNPILCRLPLRLRGRARGRVLALSINHVPGCCCYFRYSPGYGVLTPFFAVLRLYPWTMYMNRCRLTNRWSGRVRDKVPSSYAGVRAAHLNR